VKVGQIEDFWLVCRPSILTENAGCGHKWQLPLEYIGGDPMSLRPLRVAPCPKCGGHVAISGTLAFPGEKEGE
jgi:hypothetical protein